MWRGAVSYINYEVNMNQLSHICHVAFYLFILRVGTNETFVKSKSGLSLIKVKNSNCRRINEAICCVNCIFTIPLCDALTLLYMLKYIMYDVTDIHL
jgi:Mn2+/Fe2+ NRAMP family transporter